MDLISSLISTVLSAELFQVVDNQSGFLIVLLAMIVVAVALIFNAISKNEFVESGHSDHGHHESIDSHVHTHAAEEIVKPDDLKVIEGIGPKIASILNENQIFTYQQLADTSVDKLNDILDQSNLQIADPDTWPKQAQLAANGKMEELAKLQDELKGGKEVV
jgi:predicted flap endonuclease-1-like 5' DNA nuclease